MKTTAYFKLFRSRPDRAIIKDEWIEHAIEFPEAEAVNPWTNFTGIIS